ncbi:EEF1A lysine methyltransferase 4 [Microdochium nivale]|nr:EEF1A lysine methyltransferase 4 [Microdochium nivale]
MSDPDKENERLAHADYWDGRYTEAQAQAEAQNQTQTQTQTQTQDDVLTHNEATTNGQLHEWFRSAADLDDFFSRHLYSAKPPSPTSQPLILHLGSGDSQVPQHLATRGYANQLCVDFSAVVVDAMSRRHASLGLLNTAIRWQQMDIRNMDTLVAGSVDVAFDKGTLDAMIHGSPWSPPQDTLENTGAYLREVRRVLSSQGGVFLYVTYRQPHFVMPLLSCEGTNWDIEAEHLGAGDGSFGYYAFVCRPRSRTGEDQEVAGRADEEA